MGDKRRESLDRRLSMKASDVSLILTTTQGDFTQLDVPQLYVEIQSHRASLERSMSRQISFEDALYSWMENIYHPIMDQVKENMKVRIASSGKRLAEAYFDIYELAQENDFRDIPEAVQRYVDENGKSVFDFMLAMLHLKRMNEQKQKEAI